MNGHPINEIVPVMQDPPAPDILDPALQCGLYNPDACVRRGVVEAMGKTYGANAMKKAKREQEEAKARLKRLAEANVPFTLGILTDEELAAFDELINDDELREGTTAAEEKGGGGESARLQKEGEKPAVGAAAPEDMGEESTTEEEEEGKEAIIRTAAVEKAGEEKDKQKPAARAATESAKNKANLAKPKARTKVRHYPHRNPKHSFDPTAHPPHTASEAGAVGYRLVLTARQGAGAPVRRLKLSVATFGEGKGRAFRCVCQAVSLGSCVLSFVFAIFYFLFFPAVLWHGLIPLDAILFFISFFLLS